MLTGVKDFFSNFVNKDEEEYYEEDYEMEEEFDEEVEGEGDDIVQNKINFPWQKNRVVSMPDNQQSVKMKIVKPTSFEQAVEVCNLLKNKNSIILNLEYVQKETGRRFIDYISGAVDYADGKIEKISNSIFVIAPYNYEIVNDTKEQKFETKIAAPWRS